MPLPRHLSDYPPTSKARQQWVGAPDQCWRPTSHATMPLSAGDASSSISRSLTSHHQLQASLRREQESRPFTIDDKARQPTGGKCPSVNVDPIRPNIRPLGWRVPMNDHLFKIRGAVQEFLANPQ